MHDDTPVLETFINMDKINLRCPHKWEMSIGPCISMIRVRGREDQVGIAKQQHTHTPHKNNN